MTIAVPTDTHWENLRELADQLNAMTADSAWSLEPKPILRDADAIVTHVEVCAPPRRRAAGADVVRRRAKYPLDPGPLICMKGRQEFGSLDLCISHQDKSRDAVFCRVLDAVGQNTVKRILCIPYFADDVRTALALKRSSAFHCARTSWTIRMCARTESRTI